MKRAIRKAFAPFVAIDSYGTRQFCWTRREAESWVPYLHEGGAILQRSFF